MFEVKVFNSKKSGKRVVALVYHTDVNEIYVSFDRNIILSILDISPNQYSALSDGYHKIMKEGE